MFCYFNCEFESVISGEPTENKYANTNATLSAKNIIELSVK